MDTVSRVIDQEAAKRMDAIELSACTNAEIRDDMHCRLKNLVEEFETHRDHEMQKRHSMQSHIEGGHHLSLHLCLLGNRCRLEHDARLILVEERAKTLVVDLKGARDGIERLDGRCGRLETATGLLRTDITATERELSKCESHVHELQSFRETADLQMHNLERRLTDLETDGRIERLEELIPRLSQLEKTVQEDAQRITERQDKTETAVASTGLDLFDQRMVG